MPGPGDVPLPPGGVQRLLNNNVVVAVDADGRERVLMGRGIGFQLKHEGRVDPAKVEKTFVLDRKSTRLNSSHSGESRMPSSA